MIHNLQGDVIGLFDNTGTEVVRYVYDSWGKLLSMTGSLASTLGTIQTFRYRGHVYDVETGFYYLRSRYYNPVNGRFINSDNTKNSSFGTYKYCANNPTLFTDYSGETETIAIPSSGLFVSQVIQGVQLLLGAVSKAVPAVGVFLGVLLSPVHTATDEEEAEATKDWADEHTENKRDADYYGAKIENHQFKTLTPAMSMNEAVTWAYCVSSLSLDKGGMGINTKWGIYTDTQSNAIAIYPLLLPINTALPLPAPIHEFNLAGQYPHFHMPDRLFNNKHKHFHIWYGTIGGS